MAEDTAKTIEQTKGRIVEAALQAARLTMSASYLKDGKMLTASPDEVDILIRHFMSMVEQEAKFVLLLQWEAGAEIDEGGDPIG